MDIQQNSYVTDKIILGLNCDCVVYVTVIQIEQHHFKPIGAIMLTKVESALSTSFYFCFCLQSDN